MTADHARDYCRTEQIGLLRRGRDSYNVRTSRRIVVPLPFSRVSQPEIQQPGLATLRQTRDFTPADKASDSVFFYAVPFILLLPHLSSLVPRCTIYDIFFGLSHLGLVLPDNPHADEFLTLHFYSMRSPTGTACA